MPKAIVYNKIKRNKMPSLFRLVHKLSFPGRSMMVAGILLISFGFLSSAFGQEKAPTMVDLANLLSHLKSLQTYRYETEMDAIFPNGDKDSMTSRLYVDKNTKQIYYKTTHQLLIINHKWIYNTNFVNKEVRIFNRKDNKKYEKYLPELKKVFAENTAMKLFDSLLLKKAILKKSFREGDKVTFELGFPKGYYIRQFDITYNVKTQLPETIRYTVWYASGLGYNPSEQPGGTQIKVNINHYQKQIPAGIFSTGSYFKTKGGKAFLLRYKAYTLHAAL